jgi:hypothetical protein
LESPQSAGDETLLASVKDTDTADRHEQTYINALQNLTGGQLGKLTHKADPSVFFIFTTALFLIQFYADPQTAHWLLPQPHKPTLRKSQRANSGDPQIRFSETNCIFAQQ